MAGEIQTDAEDVLLPASDALLNHIADYNAEIDHFKALVDEHTSTSLIGPAGMALQQKVEELHGLVRHQTDEMERIAHSVGQFAHSSADQDHESASHMDSVDITLM